jgi:hypothetical protein
LQSPFRVCQFLQIAKMQGKSAIITVNPAQQSPNCEIKDCLVTNFTVSSPGQRLAKAADSVDLPGLRAGR